MIVTLSPEAQAAAARLRIPEPAVKRARRACFREHDEPAFLVAYAELDDNRTLRMRCRHDAPGQIVSLGIA